MLAMNNDDYLSFFGGYCPTIYHVLQLSAGLNTFSEIKRDSTEASPLSCIAFNHFGAAAEYC